MNEESDPNPADASEPSLDEPGRPLIVHVNDENGLWLRDLEIPQTKLDNLDDLAHAHGGVDKVPDEALAAKGVTRRELGYYAVWLVEEGRRLEAKHLLYKAWLAEPPERGRSDPE